MLRKFYDTIRSLRQAQRHSLQAACQTFRTWDEAQDELDRLACDGRVRATDRARVIREASSGSFVLSLSETVHN